MRGIWGAAKNVFSRLPSAKSTANFAAQMAPAMADVGTQVYTARRASKYYDALEEQPQASFTPPVEVSHPAPNITHYKNFDDWRRVKASEWAASQKSERNK
jgi:hypothetical protein